LGLIHLDDHDSLKNQADKPHLFPRALINAPHGKSWKKDLEAMGDKDGMRDPRFKVMHLQPMRRGLAKT
jgi:hypothetical protein